MFPFAPPQDLSLDPNRRYLTLKITTLAASLAKLGRLVLSRFVRCEHCRWKARVQNWTCEQALLLFVYCTGDAYTERINLSLSLSSDLSTPLFVTWTASRYIYIF